MLLFENLKSLFYLFYVRFRRRGIKKKMDEILCCKKNIKMWSLTLKSNLRTCDYVIFKPLPSSRPLLPTSAATEIMKVIK